MTPRSLLKSVLIVVVVAACGAESESAIGPVTASPSDTSANSPPPASPSPTADYTEAYRQQLEAALQDFEGNWLLFCFGVDENGNMPKDWSGGGVWPLLAEFAALDPPKGWLAVANETRDLLAHADGAALAAAIHWGGYVAETIDYDTANALWQEVVMTACADPSSAIRAIREHADAIP